MDGSFNVGNFLEELDNYLEDNWYVEDNNDDEERYFHDLPELYDVISNYIKYYNKNGLLKTRNEYSKGIISDGVFLLEKFDEDSSAHIGFIHENSNYSEDINIKGIKLNLKTDEGEIFENAIVTIYLD